MTASEKGPPSGEAGDSRTLRRSINTYVHKVRLVAAGVEGGVQLGLGLAKCKLLHIENGKITRSYCMA